MTERVEETDPTDERPHTAPEQFSVCIRCFDTEERADLLPESVRI